LLWYAGRELAGDQESDGEIDRDDLPLLAPLIPCELTEAYGLAATLVTAGFWMSISAGWRDQGFADINPTHAQREATRERDRARQQAQRDRQRAVTPPVTPDPAPPVSHGGSHGVTPPVSHGGNSTVQDSTLQNSTGSHHTSAKSDAEKSPPPAGHEPRKPVENHEDPPAMRPDVLKVCRRFRDHLEALGVRVPGARVGRSDWRYTVTWQTEARLMLDTDHRPLEDVLAVIAWLRSSEFWVKNILGVPALRKQYDRLRLEMRPVAPTATNGTGRRQSHYDSVQAEYQRLIDEADLQENRL